MDLNRKNMLKIFFLCVCVILVYLGFQHLDIVFSFLTWLLGVLTPFVIAGCFTFFLNVPLKAIEKRLFIPKPGKPISEFKNKARRPLAIVMSITLFLLVIGAFLLIVIPEIIKSLSSIADSIPGVLTNLQNWLADLSEENEYVGNFISNLKIDWKTVSDTAVNFFQNNGQNIFASAMGLVSSVVSTTINLFLGIVLAVYVLAKKEKISSDVKKLLYAVIPQKGADYIVEVGRLTNRSFYNSITGQMMECVILGCLTALGMTIFGFPYAALIGVIVAIMSWIPMFGIGIGTAIGALFLLTVNPIQAIWFVVYMICLQQIEGNLIFPRVVGSNIGLPPIILISAIILFSNTFGIIGLLVSGPITSVIYTLIKRFVGRKLENSDIDKDKYGIKYAYMEEAAEDERKRAERKKRRSKMSKTVSGIVKDIMTDPTKNKK